MPTVHSEGSRRKVKMSLLALLDCRFRTRENETHASAHLCEAYLMNTGVFGQRDSNQTLVGVDGAAVCPTSCLH